MDRLVWRAFISCLAAGRSLVTPTHNGDYYNRQNNEPRLFTVAINMASQHINHTATHVATPLRSFRVDLFSPDYFLGHVLSEAVERSLKSTSMDAHVQKGRIHLEKKMGPPFPWTLCMDTWRLPDHEILKINWRQSLLSDKRGGVQLLNCALSPLIHASSFCTSSNPPTLWKSWLRRWRPV